jgi:Domain of unknown function (DUF5122) beta-propeller
MDLAGPVAHLSRQTLARISRHGSRRLRLCMAVVGTVVGTVAVTGAPATTANAALSQGGVVSENPADNTPQLVQSGTGPRPHVDSIDRIGSTIFAGGLFDRVSEFDGTVLPRVNLMAFDADTGRLSATFSPRIDGNVWAVEAVAATGSVYVGGAFTTVNGVRRPALAKLDAATGQIDPTFTPPFSGGRINEIDLVDGRLFVGGSAGRKLMALNPRTGANTGYVNLAIQDAIPNAWGGVAVYRFAVSPDATRLVATGNFQTVAGQSRTRLFVADLGATSATLDPWYYPRFEDACASTSPRRIAYLQGVDFSPAGDYFVVVATGQIVAEPADKGWTVCDAAGRFDLDDPTRPVWINYTGGDSVWSVAVTGAAAYVQGHFQWLDNPNGHSSLDGGGASRRLGIGAIDPTTGRALPWNPPKPASMGGKDLLATPDGLWVGSDSLTFNQEEHRGLAFVPLP